MRILHVTSSLDGGGIARLLIDYYSRMKADIHFDFAITSETEGMLEKPLIEAGCNIYRIPQVRKNLSGHINSLKTIISGGDYDVVHDHSDYRSLFTMLVAHKYSVKVRIAHSHLAFVPETKRTYIERYFFSRLVKRYSTQLMACSKDAAIWMWGEKEYLEGKVYIMTNAIDTSKFLYNEELRNQVRNKYNMGNSLVLGNVGRFTYQKNHEFLIDIFIEVLNHKPNSLLLMIGDGELKKDIEEKVKALGISQNVIFLGTIPNVYEYLNAMDVFVLPSRFEGLGIVYVEAQANGMKCFATKEVVPMEANVCNNITFVPKECNAKAWSEYIINCAVERDVDVYNKIRESGYDIDRAAQRMKEYLLCHE